MSSWRRAACFQATSHLSERRYDVKGFGVHAMVWSLKWDHENARRSIAAAADYGQDFIEIPLIDIPSVDAKHTRALLEKSACAPSARWCCRSPPGRPYVPMRQSTI
ncbi:hypothetical protein AGR7A_Lc10107 [Agrobacterium deltaense NCPPB 1641]|uniref:Xylose isomerase-like TIM barrel domain-containing protein n=1 Tax=Agrobacterium deltaense NCPPB 1641 TaxID=1183425 RepID=A0A1S7TS21_9HYPH|nr:hypothetical protein AGR7A_Lc10107 [Agrobacterium deltaense NCPPB 1641]